MPAALRLHAFGLIAFGALTSILMITPVLPLDLDRRGLAPFHIGGVVGAMSLVLVVSELLAPAATSRIGRRAAAAIALAGSALALAWFPQVVSLGGLYLNRMLFGALRGMLWPVLFAEVADLGPPERRAGAFAVFWLYFGVGQLVGPALGGWLADRFSLATPFYGAAILAALTIPATAAIRPRCDDAAAGNPVAALQELLRRSPAVLRNWTLTVCNTAAFSVYTTFLPLHAASRGLSADAIGLIYTGAAVAFIAAQEGLRRTARRRTAERLIVPAFLARGIGAALTPFLPSFWSLLLVGAAAGGMGAAVPTALSTRIAGQAPSGLLVAAMGGFNAAADLGFFLGPAAGGALAGWGLTWAFLLVLPVTALALCLLLTDQSVRDHGRKEESQIDHGVPEQADR
ncbi:MAG: MFS transporter [Armatimonadota bacterium]|nr:MFS transporter [Armatimonadota bacterium]MDR7492565.1 MFS transporter [Armatimonadota bacterium]MDR7499967.1 MFS transporter [Armatimonadota bacterium]MDR7558800.1 MFS transporter [Armatimonadota bacterium]MDR7571670.1 MFS transporter [Armatimonadota bacterium]